MNKDNLEGSRQNKRIRKYKNSVKKRANRIKELFLGPSEPDPIQQTPLLENWITVAQPSRPKATVVFTALTPGGLNADGKVSARDFLPAFCDTLRNSGFATTAVSNLHEISKVANLKSPFFLVHLFGEDQHQIMSPELERLEKKAAAVFNRSNIGPLVADKLGTHKAFEVAGVKMPALINAGGFIRQRLGTLEPTIFETEETNFDYDAEQHIRTEFIDTRITFLDEQYYTSVRLQCIDEKILHIYPRARNAKEDDPNVHSKNTPLDPDLIEFMNSELVEPRKKELNRIAQKLFTVLGHGFFVHDLLISSQSGEVYVCETGVKLDNPGYWRHVQPISDKIPSQKILFPPEGFAQRSAMVFVASCEEILRKPKRSWPFSVG